MCTARRVDLRKWWPTQPVTCLPAQHRALCTDERPFSAEIESKNVCVALHFRAWALSSPPAAAQMFCTVAGSIRLTSGKGLSYSSYCVNLIHVQLNRFSKHFGFLRESSTPMLQPFVLLSITFLLGVVQFVSNLVLPLIAAAVAEPSDHADVDWTDTLRQTGHATSQFAKYLCSVPPGSRETLRLPRLTVGLDGWSRPSSPPDIVPLYTYCHPLHPALSVTLYRPRK